MAVSILDAVKNAGRTDFEGDDGVQRRAKTLEQLNILSRSSIDPGIAEAAFNRFKELQPNQNSIPYNQEFAQNSIIPQNDTVAPVLGNTPITPIPHIQAKTSTPNLDNLLNKSRIKRANLLQKSPQKEAKATQRAADRLTTIINNKPIPSRSVGETAQDVTSSIATGLVDVASVGFGLANIPTLGLVDKLFTAVDPDNKAFSQRSEQFKQIIRDSLDSEEIVLAEEKRQRAATARKIRNDKKFKSEIIKFGANFGGAIGEFIDQPGLAFDAAVESLPQMFVPGVAAKIAVNRFVGNTFKKNLLQQTSKNRNNFAKINAKRMTGKFLKSKEGISAVKKIQTRTGLSFIAASEGISNGLQVQAEILNASEKELREGSDQYVKLRLSGLSHVVAQRSIADKAALITTGVAGLFGLAAAKGTGAAKFESRLFKLDSLIGKNIIARVSNNTLMRPISNTVRGGTIEGAEETLQGAGGQFATNLGKKIAVDSEQSLNEDVADAAGAGLVVGSLAGGALAGGASFIKETNKTVKKISGKVEQKANATRDNFQEEKKIKEAVNKNDISNLTNKEDPAYSPETAFIATQRLQATSKPEDRKPAAIHLGELIDHLNEFRKEVTSDLEAAIENGDEKQIIAAEKRFNKLQKNQKFVEGLRSIDGLSGEALQEEINKLNKAEKSPENTNLVATVLGSMQSDQSVSIKDAEKLAESPSATSEQKQQIIKYIATQKLSQQVKDISSVNNEIIVGGNGNLGINQHQSNILISIESGDQNTAQTSLNGLIRFADIRAQRSDDVQRFLSIKENPDSTSKQIQKAAQELKNTQRLAFPSGANNLSLQIQKEAELTKTALEESIQIFNDNFGTKSEPDTDTESGGMGLKAEPIDPNQGRVSSEDGSSSSTPLTSQAPEVTPPNKGAAELEGVEEINKLNKAEKSPENADLVANAPGSMQSDKSVSTKDAEKLVESPTAAPPVVATKTLAQPKVLEAPTGEASEGVQTQETSSDTNVTKISTQASEGTQEAVKLTDEQAFTEALGFLRKNESKIPAAIRNSKKNDNEIFETLSRKNIKSILKKAEDLNKKINKDNIITIKEYSSAKNILENTVEFIDKKNDNKSKTLKDIFNVVETNENNLLSNTPNLLRQIRKGGNKDLISQILKQLNNDKDQFEALQKFAIFEERFRKALLLGLDPSKGVFPTFTNIKDKNFREQDLVKLFLNKEIDSDPDVNPLTLLDPNMVSQWALTTYLWAATEGKGTQFMSDRTINTFLNRSPDELITQEMYNLLEDKGTLESRFVESIGRKALKGSGLKFKKNISGPFVARMNIAVGNMITATLFQMGMIEEKILINKNIDHLVTKKNIPNDNEQNIDNEPTDQREFGKQTTFINVTTRESRDEFNNIIQVPKIENIINNSQNITKMANKLFASNIKDNKPTFEPSNDVSSTVKGTIVKVPTKIRRIIQKQQHIPHKIVGGLFSLIENMDFKNVQLIFGAVEDIDGTVQKNRRKSQEAKNKKIYDDLREIIDIGVSAKEQPDGIASSLFFRYELWKSGRLGMLNSGASSQGSKIARTLIKIKSHEIEINPADTNNPVLKNFFISIADSIGLDSTENTNILLPKIIEFMHDEVIDAGLTEIGMHNNGEKFNDKIILDAVLQIGQKGKGFAALEAWVSFVTAQAEGTTFTTTMTNEADGITNGTALNLIQMNGAYSVTKLKTMLARTGIFFNDKYQTYKEYIDDLGNLDTYQNIANMWAQGLKNFETEISNNIKNDTTDLFINSAGSQFAAKTAIEGITGLVGDFGSLNKFEQFIINELGRDLSKPPTIMGNFGASTASIMRDFNNNLIIKVYDDIAAAVDQNDQVKLTEISRNLNKAINPNRDNDFGVHLKLNTALEWTLPNNTSKEIKNLFSRSSILYGNQLDFALKAEFGVLLEKRNDIIELSDLSFELFEYVFLEKVKRKERSKGSPLTFEEWTTVTKSLEHMLPSIKTPLGITMLGMRVKYTKETNNIIFEESTKIFGTAKENQEFFGQRNLGIKNTKNTKNGGNKVRIKNTGSSFKWEPRSLSNIVNGIIAIDGAIMMDVMDNFEVLNLFDNVEVALDQSDAVSSHLNKELINISFNYDLQQEVLDQSSNILDEFNKFIKSSPSDYAPKTLELSNLINLISNRVKEDNTLKQEVLNDIALNTHYNKGGSGFITETSNQDNIQEQKTNDKILDDLVSDLLKTASSVLEESVIVDFLINTKRNKDGSLSKSKGFTTEKRKFYEANREQIDQAIIEEKLTLGSNPGSGDIDIDSFKNITGKELDNMSIANIFDMLGKISSNGNPDVGNKIEDSSHKKYLRDMLVSMTNNVIEPFKLKMKTIIASDTSRGLIKDKEIFIINGAKASAHGLNMSSQEVYAHELIHGVTQPSIDADSFAKRELRKLFDEVKALTKPEHFLNDPADINNPVEMAAAKARFDYIFNNTEDTSVKKIDKETGKEYTHKDPHTGELFNASRSNFLHEFVAFGLTNQNFIKHLQNIESKKLDAQRAKIRKARRKNKRKNTTSIVSNFFERLNKIFERILDTFNKLFVNTNNLPAFERLNTIAQQLANIDQNKKNIISQKYSVMTFVDNAIIDKIKNYVIAPLVNLSKTDAIKKNKFKVIRAIGSITSIIPTTKFTEFVEIFQATRARQGATASSFINSLFTEIVGRTPKTERWHSLSSLSNKSLDQNRKAIMQQVTKQVISNFEEGSLTKRDKKAITKVLLKLDLPVLSDVFSVNDLIKLLSNQKFLQTQINKIEQEIDTKFKANKNWYKKMSNSLANVMVHGKAIEHNTLLNAHNIARLFGANDSRKLRIPDNIELAEKLIDQLATLRGIQKSKVDANILAKIMKREYKRGIPDTDVNGVNTENGITFTMQMLQLHKKESLESLFNGHKALMIKGYTKELYDINVAFKVANIDEESALAKEGYIRGPEVQKDSTDKNTDQKMFMYVSQDAAPSLYMTGIASITGETAKGADLIKVAIQSGYEDPVFEAHLNGTAITKEKVPLVDEIFGSKPTSIDPNKDNLLVPVFNEAGGLTAYRYVMNEANKDNILNKDNSFETIIGGMMASIDDKVNGKKINELIVEEAFDEFNRDFKNSPEEFVFIGLNSEEAKFKEIYQLMPSAMRKNIKDVWGRDGLYVRAIVVELVFGKRKFSVTEGAQYLDKMAEAQGLVMKHLGGVMADYLRAPWLKKAENIWQEVVKFVKDAIVIKFGTVLGANILSNFIVLLVAGVPILDIIRDHNVAIRASKDYQRDLEEVLALQRDLKTKDKFQINSSSFDKKAFDNHNVKISNLNEDLATNPVRELNEAAVYQTIIEDITDEDNKFSYKNKLENWLDPYVTKIPEGLRTVGKTIFLAHDTPIYQFMRNATQISDFVARYTLHQHNLNNKKMSKKESIKVITDSFINYDLPTHKGIQYANDMGFIMFTKFMLRIQRTLLHSAKGNPGRVLALFALQSLFGDVQDVFNTNLITGPIASRFNFDPVNFVYQSTQTPFIKVLQDIG